MKLSPEAQAALKDQTPVKPPFCFQPNGYPRSSPGFGLPPGRYNKEQLERRNWHYKPKGKR